MYTEEFTMNSGGTRAVKATLQRSTPAASVSPHPGTPGLDGVWKLPPGASPPAIAPFDAKKAKQHQEAWAKYLRVQVEMKNSIGMRFVLIPPGEFDMGSTEADVARLIEQANATKQPEWYASHLYATSPTDDPMGPLGGPYRVFRGGDWFFDVCFGRASYRFRDGPGYGYEGRGYRLARSVSFPSP